MNSGTTTSDLSASSISTQADEQGAGFNGICKTLDAYYGAIPIDDTHSEWVAVKVRRDGNAERLSSPVDTVEEAEAIAERERQADLQANSQFGVGA
jgi:hypothetical protein